MIHLSLIKLAKILGLYYNQSIMQIMQQDKENNNIQNKDAIDDLLKEILSDENKQKFHKNPNAVVTDCGRFIPKNGEQLLMQSVFNNFFGEDKEDGT